MPLLFPIIAIFLIIILAPLWKELFVCAMLYVLVCVTGLVGMGALVCYTVIFPVMSLFS